MPRTVSLQSLLASLKQQSSRTVVALRQEIARRERELTELKAEAARWSSVVARGAKAGKPATAASGKRRVKRRGGNVMNHSVIPAEACSSSTDL